MRKPNRPCDPNLLGKRIEDAVTGNGPSRPPDARSTQDPKLADVVAITREMFGAAPIVETCVDPDDPEHPFVVFTVPWAGGIGESVERRLEWHERVAEATTEQFGILRLSLIPV